MTDSSGFPIGNTHNGDTTILGDLNIEGNVFVNNALGQSEYLDAGNYTSIISNVVGITNVSFDSVTRTYYEKQGNLIKLYVSLKITFTTSLTSGFTFDMTVPALDIFEKKINGTFCIANGGFVSQFDADGFANVINQDGTVRVIFQRLPPSTVALPFGGDAYGSVILIYKLEGEDVPASVLLAGGSGSGDVSNPMLETLDGGGFNILNVDSIVANTITATNVVTNPLSNNLNANNQNITNINSVDATTLNATNTNTSIISTDTINSLVASDITFSNNLNINDNIIKGCNELNSQNGDLIIKGLTSGGTFPASKISLEAFKVDLTQCPNGLDMGTHPIDNAGLITTNELRVNNINARSGSNLNITNPDLPIVITGSSIEMRSNPPNTGKVEFYTGIDMTDKTINNVQNIITQRVLGKAGTPLIIDSAIGFDIELKDNTKIEGNLNMNDNNIENVSILTSTDAMEFKAVSGYIFDNYVDFTTKRFNGIKYIKAQVDFEDLNNIFGIYVIVGNVVMTEPLVITAPCLISGYNNLSTLTFNITTGNEGTFCISNTNNSGNVEFKDFIFTNQNISTRSGIFLANSGINTNILRVSNISFYNCKNNYPLRILGFELAEILNCTFRYNYGGSGGAMLSLNTVKNTVIESCEFYNNYQLGNTSNIYVNYLLFISGTCDNITISANQFSTYGALSLGGVSIGEFGTSINRVIIDGNIFDAQGGSDPLKLLDVNTTIHKGVICNENTGIVTCKASLEGLVNGNVVYTETQAGVWVPIDLTGFVTGIISRFTPGLSPYSFIYDASDPIKTLITVNCAADHSTGGTDTVRLGISVNGTVNVFVQADLNSGQTRSTNITTVLNLNFGDVLQIVCQNITAGTNINGFRAVSLNASLIEI